MNNATSSMRQNSRLNHLLTIFGGLIIFLLIVLILLLSYKPTEPSVQTQTWDHTQPAANTSKASAVDKLSTNYQSCIDESDRVYQDALSKIPGDTDQATRWNYIQNVQQIIDSHKTNCDRIYQIEKDKLNMES